MSGGGTSTSSSSAATGWDNPSPPSATSHFPFPQNRKGAHCAYPSTSVANLNAIVTATYNSWSAPAVLSASGIWSGGLIETKGPMSRVVDPQGDPNGNYKGRTISEGIGYGMLITVYMDKQPLFNQLWAYAKAHFNGNGLMGWEIDAQGNAVQNGGNNGSNSATDGDEDMAWALLMADKQWGSSGGVNYLSDATALLKSMHGKELTPQNQLTDGDWTNNGTHPDYGSPAYYADFATASGQDWASVGTAEYSLLNGAQNKTTGLIPDANGSGQFGYDACRAPWRVGIDYCMNGTSAAQSFLTPMIATFVKIGAMPLALPMNVSSTANGASGTAAITGPAGVGAMAMPPSAANQTFIDQAFNKTHTWAVTLQQGSLQYFGSTLGLVSMVAMTGNFFDYRNPPP